MKSYLLSICDRARRVLGAVEAKKDEDKKLLPSRSFMILLLKARHIQMQKLEKGEAGHIIKCEMVQCGWGQCSFLSVLGHGL